MKTFYISLVRDLFGCYLQVEADSERAVRLFLAYNYYHKDVWQIPWCAIYDTFPKYEKAIIIKADRGPIEEAFYVQLCQDKRRDDALEIGAQVG